MIEWPWILGAVTAGLGGVAYMMRRYRQPRAVLEVFTSSALEQGWTAHLAGVYAVSVKVTDGANPYKHRASMLQILDQAEAEGCERHAWGYHYCRTIEDAEAEADAAAEGAIVARARVYYWNAEKQWAGTSSDPGATDPIATSQAFARRFKARAPGIMLGWQAWTTRAARNQGSPHSVVDTVANVRLFDVWAPMITASKPSTIAAEWATDADKYAMSLPQLIRGPLVGSGRAIGDGQAMGYFDRQGDAPGLRELVAGSGVPWILYWYGNGSEGMLTNGNEINPPLVAQIDTMHADRGLGRRVAV